jgi:ABC-type iron transport system FetAB ATPase subunit
MSANNRVSLLRNLTKAQALMLIDDINQAMAENREEDIEAVINLIRDKDLPLEAIISRMEAA